jgi:translation initiation factor IF-2
MAVQPRPPVVTIMGHVDHGKTSFLDAIRKTSVAAKESGGITQHIGAYQVEKNGKPITFIDTPGHAAFAKMRSRGAAATDVVVLVVSATEGVKPQTIESIQHIKKAGVQYLVALTKMDLPDKKIDMVKAQLTEHEVFVEGYGGDIVCVPVSSKTGEGLDKLLEMILLVAELMELKADPDADVEAIVIESKRDSKKGTVATVLVKNGTLKSGDTVFANQTELKIKSMIMADGKIVKTAGPSTPVELTGWDDVPAVGSIVAKTKAQIIAVEAVAETAALDADRPALKLILKADATGTLEAIENSISGDEVIFISKGVGNVTEADVLLAESTKARILAFRVKAPASVESLAESTKVKIKSYSVIYELIEDIQKQTLRLLEPTIDEEELGVADVVAVFDMKGERIAGCRIKSGEIARGQLTHIKREDKIIADPKIKSMRTGKVEIESAKAGNECGIVFRAYSDIQVGDVIQTYRVKED